MKFKISDLKIRNHTFCVKLTIIWQKIYEPHTYQKIKIIERLIELNSHFFDCSLRKTRRENTSSSQNFKEILRKYFALKTSKNRFPFDSRQRKTDRLVVVGDKLKADSTLRNFFRFFYMIWLKNTSNTHPMCNSLLLKI